MPDFTGPVLFDPPAAGSLLAQALAPSLSGARPPLSTMPAFDEIMQRMGGRSEWSGRVNTRVLPANVSLIDDPTLKEFKGQPLLGNYEIDDEGVKAQRVEIVENGSLKNLLMSRRPGPEFSASNGHARSAAALGHASASQQSVPASEWRPGPSRTEKEISRCLPRRRPRMVPGSKEHG